MYNDEIKYFKRGGLRLWVLSILEKSPKNGAELMNQIDFASQGLWRPSPGSIYPLLETLTTIGSIRKREDGKYEITEKGRQELEWPLGIHIGNFGRARPRDVDEMIEEMESTLSYLEDLKTSNTAKMESVAPRLKNIKERIDKITGQ